MSSLFLCQIKAAAVVEGLVEGAVPKDVYSDYLAFIGDRDPLDITYYGGANARRDVIEVVLTLQALAIGGSIYTIDFKEVESYARQLAEVSAGRSALTMTTIWESDANSHSFSVYSSDALVDSTEFIAGFYVNESNHKALQSKTLQDLQQLTVVCNASWRRDWDLLHSLMPPDNIYKSVIWSSMVKMVHFNRVDFVLAPFQRTPDMALVFEDIRLLPIPGIKVSLNESRHSIISKKHPLGRELFDYFNRGLALMKQRGILKKAYTEAGFFNEKVDTWTLINP
jgi:hypothetical protein